jgi:outer membrane protein assembly factor BamB
MRPGLNRDVLVVINGSRLYACNRYNGDLLREIQIDNALGAGAAVSELRAFVPMVNGLVMAFRLDPVVDPLAELGNVDRQPTEEQLAVAEEERRENIRIRQEYIPPLACRSTGRALVQPLVTSEDEAEEYVAWPTDRGYLNIAYIDRRRDDHFAIKYRLETDAGIAARPAYLPPDPEISPNSGVIFGASKDGFVHAIEERTGQSLWRFSTGEPIVEAAVAIGHRVYVATQLGGMHCLDAKTGAEHWWAPRIVKFVSASNERVYAADKLGRVLILSAKTGARLDVLEATTLPIKLSNWRTDRLYLATETGLIQCLHEIELSEPIRHDDVFREAAQRPAIEQGPAPDEAAPPVVPDQPQPQPPAADPFAPPADNPFAPQGGAAGGGANPPVPGADAPPADNDPFGADNPFN